MKAAVYTRVSTEEQTKGQSLDFQEDLIKNYADGKGYEIYDVYRDEGYSGKDLNRPEFQRLITDLRNDKFDVILAWHVDRISRNNADVILLINDELNPNNKKLVITSGDIDSSDSNGYMYISFLSTFARFERSMIIERVNAGMQKRAEKGLWNGGAILGYDTIDKALVVNEREESIVKEIFKHRAEGKGYKYIANELNTKGIKTKKGKAFSIPGIKLILNNHIYIGKMVWKKHQDWSTKRRKGRTEPIIVDGIHEPIIEKELWEKVQTVNKLQKKTFTTNRNFNGNFYLSGILKCPKCGAGTVMSKSKKKNGDYHFYYMCQSFHSKGKSVCRANLIKKEIVEEKVFKEISFLVNNGDVLNALIKELGKDNVVAKEAYQAEINLYKKKQKELIERRSKLDEDYFMGNIESTTYNRLMIGIEKQIKDIERGIRRLEQEITSNEEKVDKDLILDTLKNFEQFFALVSDEERKLLIRSLIKEIQMEENRKDVKEITFWFSSVPSLPSNKAGRAVP